MKKKKFGAILAAGVMSCTLVAGFASTGCIAKMYEFDMPKDGYTGDKVEITFANTTGQTLANVIDAALERFKDIYPNISVKIDNSNKKYDDLKNSITTKFTTGKQPNLAFCYSDHVALYNQSNAVLPLSDYFMPGSGFENITATQGDGTKVKLGLTTKGNSEKAQIGDVEDYVEKFYEEGKVYGDGKVYTLPFAKSTEVLYYNQKFFNDNNLQVPETWEQMATTCQQIKDIIAADDKISTEDKKKIYPLGYDSGANFFITLCNQYDSPYTSATGDHFLFDNEKNREFVQMLKDWYGKGYFTTEDCYGSYTSSLFTDQKCFMSIGSTGGSSYQDPDKTDGAPKFNVGVAQIPQVDTENPLSILQGPSVCIFKKENPQEVLASWLLVKFLTTDHEFQARYSEVSGYMPVTKSTYYDYEPYSEFLTEDSLQAKTAVTCEAMVQKEAFYTSPAFFGSSEARERVGMLMKTVLLGSRTIEDAFEDAVKKCNDYIG